MSKDLLKMKTKSNRNIPPVKTTTSAAVGGGSEAAALEVRPGGMLVQMRNSDYNQSPTKVPTIKLRVKYGSSYQEVKISSQANFGELKKMLAKPTGVHQEDQKIFYKEKERDSRSFLDVAGLKDGSKLVLIEDDISKEKRCLESRRNAKMENASKEITAIRFEIDKLAKQVANVEMVIYGGKEVTETVLLNLIELLMTQLIKLDGITADGDLKLQRRMQVKRVQKYIETLDMLKIRNLALGNHNAKVQHGIFTGKKPTSIHHNQKEQRNQGQVVVTTKWETF